jgi:hypothetical protein
MTDVWRLDAFKPLGEEGSSETLWSSKGSFTKDEGRIKTK